MEMAKPARPEEAPGPKEEKEPMLKCHEMRLIFQRLPTSELVRFISNAPKHPLGKFWSQELKLVVEKRLPFSVKAAATSTSSSACRLYVYVIFDCNGSRVAEIKRPKQFHLSPVCELIECADVPAIAPTSSSSLPPRFMFPTPDILSTLKNLDTLALSLRYVTNASMRDPVDLTVALSPELMRQIHTLTLDNLHDRFERAEKPLLEILTRATSLKKLSISDLTHTLFTAIPSEADGLLGLESLRILHGFAGDMTERLFEILASRFSGLRELFLPVVAHQFSGPRDLVRQYLAAFQALPSLTTLGLAASEYDLHLHHSEKQLSVDENDAPIVSVTELFVTWKSFDGKEPQALLPLLLKFPNVQSFGADFQVIGRVYNRANNRHAEFLLRFASAVCSSGVFAHLRTLELFSSYNAPLTRAALLQFIRANIDHLPSSVDLSQVATDEPRTVGRNFLVDLCLALQGGRITSLAFKDLVHREAVPRLREHFALGKQGRVSAWLDEESINERRIRSQKVSDFTDFRIKAYKTSGPLKLSAFKIRISNWTETRKTLLDVKLV